jgi:hypothetical protein
MHMSRRVLPLGGGGICVKRIGMLVMGKTPVKMLTRIAMMVCTHMGGGAMGMRHAAQLHLVGSEELKSIQSHQKPSDDHRHGAPRRDTRVEGWMG